MPTGRGQLSYEGHQPLEGLLHALELDTPVALSRDIECLARCLLPDRQKKAAGTRNPVDLGILRPPKMEDGKPYGKRYLVLRMVLVNEMKGLGGDPVRKVCRPCNHSLPVVQSDYGSPFVGCTSGLPAQ